MADDQQPRAQQPDGDGELDETRPHEPVQDTAESAGSGPWGAPPPGPAETGPHAPDDTVVVQPRDETAVLPPGGGDRWSGRAGIPPAAPTGASDVYDQDQEGRGWWVPAVLALLGLLLLAALATGVWLILRSREEPSPGPAVSPTPTVSPTSASPQLSPTPAPSPTPSLPVPVRVPLLVGLTRADAQQVLDTVGLTYRVEERVDPDSQPGRVIAVNPAEGTLLPPGSRVTLVVAVAPPTTAAPSPTLTTSPTPG